MSTVKSVVGSPVMNPEALQIAGPALPALIVGHPRQKVRRLGFPDEAVLPRDRRRQLWLDDLALAPWNLCVDSAKRRRRP